MVAVGHEPCVAGPPQRELGIVSRSVVPGVHQVRLELADERRKADERRRVERPPLLEVLGVDADRGKVAGQRSIAAKYHEVLLHSVGREHTHQREQVGSRRVAI